MRQSLVSQGSSELSYEIREIVNKADALAQIGQTIYWENIGDPLQKNWTIPRWIKDIVSELAQEDKSYGYTHSMGNVDTRKFIAEQTNKLDGAKIDHQDVIFFNGLGDGISTFYQFIEPTSRILGPSPAYSTHSSGEAAHANSEALTYQLDPSRAWAPDIDEIYNQVQYNPNIVGILIINPDNPTGMVYTKNMLKEIVSIARKFDLFILSDEIYGSITYNGAEHFALSEMIEDVPGIAMKGMSKDMPWPGSRCGWMEFYNRGSDSLFNRLYQTMVSAKMLEVCSTTLPQLALPKVYGHPKYLEYNREVKAKIGRRSKQITDILKDIPYIYFNPTYGAFYNTIIFKPNTLTMDQSLKIDNSEAEILLTQWLQEKNMKADKRFVYYLLAAKGVCVVPISSFCSDLLGFRVTLLEEDEDLLTDTFTKIKDAVIEYCES